ncbi:MAG: DUF2812 domain-containing protein [Aristaeellaceae bacterium]
MRTISHRWFWAWEFEEEEAWLNEMAKQGKALVSARYLTYEFEDSAPGEYAVRLEMLADSPNSAAGQQYLSFVEETGAEYVGRVLKWVYFRKKAADGPFELHGDNATRIRHLKGIMRLVILLFLMEATVCFGNLSIALGVGAVLNLFCALLCGVFAGLLVRGYIRLNERKKRLEKDARLFE